MTIKSGKLAWLPILAYLITFVGGCAGRDDKQVLARVDRKDVITVADFNDRISKLPARYQEIVNKNKAAFLDELVVDSLLHDEAMRKKLQKDPEVKDVFEEAKKKILISRLLQQEVGGKVTVSEEEIEQYYNANNDQFTTPEVLRASHILVKTEKEAKDALVELSNGRNFEDLARARSVDPTAKVGGDIGYFARRQLVPEVEEVCYSMQPGDISGIVKTNFGYHVIKLTERKAPRVKELDEVRDVVRQSLKRLKQKTLFNDFVEKLKERSQIDINQKLLATISEEESPEKTPQK